MEKKHLPNKSDKSARTGTLIIIGGHEDKTGKMEILTEVARRVGSKGKLCIATTASTVADELWTEYRRVFTGLGVEQIAHLEVSHRHEVIAEGQTSALDGATAVFFTGGDQLKITSEIGGTEIAARIAQIYAEGGLIAGTSAGASVMSETMLVSGSGDATYRIGSGLRMAPGLGFVHKILIDQHFAERGRIGRLMGAIAQNPGYLGIGIDENTAIILDQPDHLRVMGAGGVYIVDAHGVTDSNISDASRDDALSLFNVKFHLLSAGDEFDIAALAPSRGDQSSAA